MKRVICILSTLCICMMLLPARLNAAEICQQSRFSSTFLQNWLCRDWTEERWIHEFSDAKAAGFDSLIIQSTYDIVRGDCTGNKQDMLIETHHKVHQSVLKERLWAAVSTFRGASFAGKIFSLMHGLLSAPIRVPEYVLSITSPRRKIM